MNSAIKGHSSEEALASRRLHGSNRLTAQKTESFRDKLLKNFKDPIIKILIVALLINVALFFAGKAEWYESLGIAIAVLLATFVSTWSESSNESAFRRLQEEASRISCKIYRDGQLVELPIDDIVVGDSVLLQPGDMIPADGVLRRGFLKVDQASMTGESREIRKEAPVDNGAAMEHGFESLYHVFRGTIVASGEAVLMVENVGDKTLYGKLAEELQIEDRESPLKFKLTALAGKISRFGYFGSILIALSFMFKRTVIDNGYEMALIATYFADWQNLLNDLVKAVILAIIIIVAAVPEGLPMMIAMVLSLNMRKLLADNLLVRKLVGIETAGSLNLLFTDKTGTITKGELEVVSFVAGDGSRYATLEELPFELRKMVELSLTRNTSSVVGNCEGDGPHLIVGGNATDRALLAYIDHHAVCSFTTEKVNEIPFSSDAKLSATELKGEYNLTLVKGAGEVLLDKCVDYFTAEGATLPLQTVMELSEEMDRLAERSIRVVALAYSKESIVDDAIPAELTLVGIVGIRDEIRTESLPAIKAAQDAGIQVVMITGDKRETAHAIAKETGLWREEWEEVLTSEELNRLSDEEVKELLPRLRVVARALPSDKSRLVRLAQELELVVGMTGDGVNDAPALKAADVGFAMGSGTEVAKEASDIVVMDDNFLSITKAVLYGRTIFNSIRKFVVFQLTINVALVFVAFFGPFIGVELPFSMTQILWINLVMDTLAAIAFGGEAALSEYMAEKPKSRTEPILSAYMWNTILIDGLFIAALSIFFLRYAPIRSMFRTGATGHGEIYFLTGFFTFFVFLSTFNAFNARTQKLNLFADIQRNKLFLKIMLLIFAVQIAMTYFGGEILRTAGLVGKEWLIVVGMALLIIPFDLLRKLFCNKKEI